MIRGLYTAVSGLVSEEAKQQVISNNLANANTNGYKKDNLIFKDFNEVMMMNYDKVVNGKNVRQDLGKLSMGTKIDDVVTKFTQGAITDTGKKTDFAIDGKGFFTVQDNAGKMYYTRDGSFRVDIQGELVTPSGYKVLGYNSQTNKIEPIRVGNNKIQCDNLGNVSLNGKNVYKFSVAGFKEGEVKKVGDNLFTSSGTPIRENTYIKQGSIEKSNLNVMGEMIDMMTGMRNFESNQKVVQTIDESLGKLISQVGDAR